MLTNIFQELKPETIITEVYKAKERALTARIWKIISELTQCVGKNTALSQYHNRQARRVGW